jgi:hypothetical protein
LKSHKTAKGILGKIWRIQTIIWKYLANPCAPLAGPEGATFLESLHRHPKFDFPPPFA